MGAYLWYDRPFKIESLREPMIMKTRIRDQWRNPEQQASTEDNARALAYICWQLALTATRNLHAEDFLYQNDNQRVAVIREYLVFLVHTADRLAFAALDETQRTPFISLLAHDCADHLQRNAHEILGEGDYAGQFIEMLNQRNSGYGRCTFDNGQAGYSLLRTFGDHIQAIMGQDQTNRWVIDQIMDIDGPEVVAQLATSLRKLSAHNKPAEGDKTRPTTTN